MFRKRKPGKDSNAHIVENNPYVSAITGRVLKILHSDTRRRLASGAIWGALATVGSRGVTVLASFFLARILGKVGFGEYGMVNSTAAMIGSLAGMGLGLTVTKHVAEFRDTDTEKVGRILALSFIVTILGAGLYGFVFFALAPWLAESTLAAPQLTSMLRISAITVVLSVVNGVQTGTLTGVEAFRVNSIISVATNLVQTTLMLVGAWQFGITGAVAGMAAGMIVTVTTTRLAISRECKRRNIRLHWRDAFTEWRVLVHFSLPTFLTMAIIGPGYWICSAFLANQQNGYAELGVFNASTQWQGAIAVISGIIGSGAVPVMSQKIGAGDMSGSFHIMWRMMGVIACVVVPMGIIVSIASPWIMEGYGSAFRSGHITLVILCVAATLTAVMYPVSQYVIAAGQMWPAFFVNFVAIIIMIAASWALVRFGAEGLSTARLISILVHSLLFFIYAEYQRRLYIKKNH